MLKPSRIVSGTKKLIMRKLKEAELRERLKSYDDPTITDHLYDFGKMLVSEVIERNNRLETKAGSIAAYSIGLITLLASTYSIWKGRVSTVGILIGCCAAFTATVLTVWAIKLQWYEAPSQNDWFNGDVLDNREDLRKYHLITLLGVFDCHEAAADKKARRVGWAQLALFTAAGSIFLSLLFALLT